jgi:hypothetical protein
MVYGSEVMLSSEMQAWQDVVDLLEESRDIVVMRLAMYQQTL